MKKTLVALAALAATSAFAQSSVTIYGQLDSGVYRVKNLAGTDKSATVYGDGAIFSPILGFKGSEDMGRGLKAGFDLQTDVQSNNGGENQNGQFRRQANVSVGGGFGEVKLGITTNPIIATNGALMPTGANGNTVSTVTSTALGYADFYTKNAVTYTSPAIMGVTAQLQKGMSNDTAAASNGSMSAYSLAYVQGPLELRYAAQERNAATAGIAATAPNGSTAATYDKKSSVMGAKYTVGQWSVGVATMKSEGQLGYDYNGITKNGATSVKERKANQMGVAYTTGAWTLGGSLTKADASKITTLQARYALSKRTNIIGLYSVADNKGTLTGFSPLAFNTGSAPSTILDSTAKTLQGEKQSGFGVGITHSF
jgi:predicted porin